MKHKHHLWALSQCVPRLMHPYVLFRIGFSFCFIFLALCSVSVSIYSWRKITFYVYLLLDAWTAACIYAVKSEQEKRLLESQQHERSIFVRSKHEKSTQTAYVRTYTTVIKTSISWEFRVRLNDGINGSKYHGHRTKHYIFIPWIKWKKKVSDDNKKREM